MWHEARKQERKIRCIMVNYKKRAERRRAFYERMKTDPTTFLRIQGSGCKIHIDHQNADNINMMPWQGDKNVMIDRFDVRAHLDYIPEPTFAHTASSTTSSEEKKLNYERYRTLVMIEASGATEEVYLRQLRQEEENPRAPAELVEKKDKPAPKASIGYTYENSNLVMNEGESDFEGSESDSDMDLDIDVAVNVDELDDEQRDQLDNLALKFGMEADRYCSLLKADKDEAEHVQKVQDEEEARSQLRGRRAKRDRRSMKDRQRGTVTTSPLSYLRKASPSYEAYRESRSRSRSSSSDGEPTKVEYITEFGSPVSKDSKDSNSTHSDRKKSSDQKKVKSKHKTYDNDYGQSKKRSENCRKYSSERRSRSTSREHRSKYRSSSRSRSRSPICKRRSYRRSRSRSSSGERHSRDSYSSNKRTKSTDYEKMKSDKTKLSLSGDKAKLTPQEKLKKRMQLALNKQLKIDKKEERKKKEVKEQEKQVRDDDLKEVSMRWKEHKRYRYSRSRSYSPEYRN